MLRVVAVLLTILSLGVTGALAMQLTSPEFNHNGYIPEKFTCEGQDINPPLAIQDIPKGTKSLSLIVDDPDAPAKVWVHWVVCDMPIVYNIQENSIPGTQGINDSGDIGYGSPCPPTGVHRYFFKLYALDVKLDLTEGLTKKDLEAAMEGHILAKAELVGLYKRKGR